MIIDGFVDDFDGISLVSSEGVWLWVFCLKGV